MSERKVVAVIPARMESSRFPGKPLVKIRDLPMVEMVRRRVCLCDGIDEVYVATCNKEIIDAVEQHGGKAIMTANTHERCTDRVEEAMQHITGDIVVIVQGDEPLLDPLALNIIIEPMMNDDKILCANLLSVIQKEEDLSDIDIVKAVINRSRYVMYYSRSAIPHMRVRKGCPLYRQTGLSGFTKSFLHQYSRLAATPLEIAESVDFLRILEHGHSILGVIYDHVTVGVDRSDDIRKVEQILSNDPHQWNLYQKTVNL